MTSKTAPQTDGAALDRRAFIGGTLLLAGAATSLSSATAAGRDNKSPLVAVVPEPAQAPVSEGFIDVKGARLWYWDTGGKGEPVVLLHPGTGSGASWAYQQPAFVAAGYRVIGYSRRSHYKSENIKTDNAPPGSPPSDLDDLQQLRTQLKLDRFHLLGSAAGGFLGAQYVVNFPDTLLSVVLACSLMNIQDAEFQQLQARLVPANFHDMPVEFREISPSYRAANPQGTARWLEIEKQSRAVPLGAMQAGAARPMPPPAVGSKRVTYASLDEVSAKVPILFLTADADLYMSPALLAMVASKVHGSELAIIENAGHAAFWEQPEAFNREVLNFFKRHRR